jgi:hypothetical protein
MREHSHVILLIMLVAAFLLFVGAAVLVTRRRTASSMFQFLGAVGLMLVAFAHAAEAYHWLPRMRWGTEHSAGHYLDLAGAVAAVALFPLGYLLQVLRGR